MRKPDDLLFSQWRRFWLLELSINVCLEERWRLNTTLRKNITSPHLSSERFIFRRWSFKAALLEGTEVDPSHLNYSASPAREGRLFAFSSSLLMAYSVVSDTTGSNRVHRHDSGLFNSPLFSPPIPPLCFCLFGSDPDWEKVNTLRGAVSRVRLSQNLTRPTECRTSLGPKPGSYLTGS